VSLSGQEARLAGKDRLLAYIQPQKHFKQQLHITFTVKKG